MVHIVEATANGRRKDGRLTRPRSWQSALTLCLRGVAFERTRRQVIDGKALRREAVGERSEDFANSHPDLALEALVTVVAELAAEGDHEGARHWQTLADDLGDWLSRDSFSPAIDPWASAISEPDAPKQPRPKGRTPAEVDAFFSAINRRSASGTRFYALALLLAYTGMRVGEALEMRDADLDLAAGVAHVRRGKTAAATRTVMLPSDPEKAAQLAEAIAAWRKVRASWNPTLPLLFVGKPYAGGEPRPWFYQSVQRTFREVSERAGIGEHPITPHQFRHTYASILIGRGAPVTGVSRQLGHANPSITLRTYAWCISGEQQDAVSRF
jgi:integrase